MDGYYWELITIGVDGSRETHDLRTEDQLSPGDRFPIEHYGEAALVEVDGLATSHIEGRAKVTAHVVEP